MTAYAADPVQPAQPAAGVAEAVKPSAEVNKQSGTMAVSETAKPAVEINKQSDSVVPTLTVNQPSGKPALHSEALRIC